MEETAYFVETVYKNGYKMNHRFFDFLQAINLCKQINLDNAKTITLKELVYNGVQMVSINGVNAVDMLELLLDNR